MLHASQLDRFCSFVLKIAPGLQIFGYFLCVELLSETLTMLTATFLSGPAEKIVGVSYPPWTVACRCMAGRSDPGLCKSAQFTTHFYTPTESIMMHPENYKAG